MFAACVRLGLGLGLLDGRWLLILTVGETLTLTVLGGRRLQLLLESFALTLFASVFGLFLGRRLFCLRGFLSSVQFLALLRGSSRDWGLGYVFLEALVEGRNGGGLVSELFNGEGLTGGCNGRGGSNGLHVDIFRFDNSFDSNFNKIGEAVADQLTVVDNLEQVADKDSLCADVLVRARTREAGIVLAAAREQLAYGQRHRHGQHQVVSADQVRVREDTRKLLVPKTRLIRLQGRLRVLDAGRGRLGPRVRRS